MKKAKIFLTALTVFAVVGGALAFKVRHNTKFYSCSDRLLCEIFVTETNWTTLDGTIPVQVDELNKPCPTGVCQTSISITD